MYWTLEEDSSFLPRSDPSPQSHIPTSKEHHSPWEHSSLSNPLLTAERLSLKKEPKDTQSGPLYKAELQPAAYLLQDEEREDRIEETEAGAEGNDNTGHETDLGQGDKLPEGVFPSIWLLGLKTKTEIHHSNQRPLASSFNLLWETKLIRLSGSKSNCTSELPEISF